MNAAGSADGSRSSVEPGYGDEAFRLGLSKRNKFDTETDERLRFRLHNISVDVEYFIGDNSPVDPLHAGDMVLEVAAMLDRKLRELSPRAPDPPAHRRPHPLRPG